MHHQTRSDFENYGQAVQAYLGNDTRRIKSLLNSESLKQTEKQLLRARLEMQAARLSNARQLLETMTSPAEPFLRAERAMLRATVESRSSRFESAIDQNLSALELYTTLEDSRGRFLTSYNLSVDFARLGHAHLSKRYLDLALCWAQTPSEKTLALRALSTHASGQNDYASAIRYIEEALKSESHEIDRGTLKLVAADIYVRAGQLAKALDCYKNFSANERCPEYLRAIFERQCLKFLLEDVSWPVSPAELIAGSEYYLKWKTMRHLDQGETKEAELTWFELQKLFPRLYVREFSFAKNSESNSLMGRCLDKLKLQSPVTDETLDTESLSPRIAALIKLFERRQLPMRKEEIIERLWKCDYDPSMDARFYKLLSRVRRLPKIHVELKNRRYRIIRL